MLSQLSELIPHTKRIPSETLPKRLIVMSSSNITITVKGEQAGKPINYSDPALGNSTDCSGVDNYKCNDKDKVKFRDKNKDRDN